METTAHVLKDCRWARDFWENTMNVRDIPVYQSFKDWLGEFMDHKSQREVELFGVCAWQVWSARNEFWFDKVYVAPDLCYKRAVDLLEQYKKANAAASSSSSRRESAKWCPPPDEFIKLM